MSEQNYAGSRVLRWEKFKGARNVSALVIATGFGAGLSPFAPGTLGTLVGVPIQLFSADWPVAARLAIWGILLIAGIWAAKVFDELNGSKDNQNIVMDEVVGYGITAWTAGTHPATLAVAFVLFRIFDVLKPPPVRQLDRWSRSKAPGPDWSNGIGVMIDDVGAGIQGLIVVLLLQYFGLLP
jgi:phosphatidylglycerophosphatase A